ncbi:MAG: methyltransferase domain-containing protein [Clostridiales bacterium]|nr:methyltransferase domain-containing protein [Clostridiales bacterium]
MDKREYTAKTREYFDALAPTWDDISIHNESKLRLITGLASFEPGDRLLDIGCGTGVMIGPLLAKEPRELTALDLSPCMIELAAQKYRDARLRLLNKDFFALKETGFDLALFYSVYPHFPDKEELARHTARCLVRGGRFMVAHSESKDIINSRHKGGAAALSEPLRAAETEAKTWREYFDIDILIDTKQLYIVSGLRK